MWTVDKDVNMKAIFGLLTTNWQPQQEEQQFSYISHAKETSVWVGRHKNQSPMFASFAIIKRDKAV